jgi:hypothetical protein
MKEELKHRVARDGTMLGDAVPNSKYYRTFCWTCGEPMRTMMHKLCSPIYCEECGGHTIPEYVDLRDLHNYPSQENTPKTDSEGDDGGIFEKKIRMKF